MKKHLLLFLALLIMVGTTMAQDVYVSGTNRNNEPAVFKNGVQLYADSTVFSEPYKYYSNDVTIDPYSTNVYWIVNVVDGNDNYFFGDIFMNDGWFLNSPLDEASHINKLYWCPFFYPNGEPLFAIGTISDVNNKKYACVWNGSDAEPMYSPEYGTIYESEPYGITVMPAGLDFYVVYYCGYRALKSDGIPHACLWMNSTCYPLELPQATGASRALDITNYDGRIYTVGEYTKGTETKGFIMMGTEIIYDLGDTDGNSSISKIIVDGGDLYFIGSDKNGNHVWRNGDIIASPNYTPVDICATPQGIWYLVNTENGAEVYCNNSLVKRFPDLSIACGLYVDSYCTSSGARSLPYYEDFNMGTTDWDCWTVDYNPSAAYSTADMMQMTESPYWHRSRVKSDLVDGENDYYAVHGYHQDLEVGGLLTTPLLHLDDDADSIKLSYLQYLTWGSYIVKPLSIIVYMDSGLPTFDEVYSFDHSDETDWTMVEVDLTAYKGKDVYIGFYYLGQDADEWQIDNVLVYSIYNSSPQSYPVTVSCNPEEGSVFGGGDYPAGTTIAISAVANEGFQFKSWQDGVADNPRVVEVNSPMNFFALFERTDIAENGMNPIAVIPNPANTSIRVQGLPKDAVVNIYNTLGTLVKSVPSSREEINISDLAAGVYFINVDHTYVKFMVY